MKIYFSIQCLSFPMIAYILLTIELSIAFFFSRFSILYEYKRNRCWCDKRIDEPNLAASISKLDQHCGSWVYLLARKEGRFCVSIHFRWWVLVFIFRYAIPYILILFSLNIFLWTCVHSTYLRLPFLFIFTFLYSFF